MRAIARSFRRLSVAEAKSMTARRLKIIPVGRRDTVDALAGRSGIHGARWPGADPAAFCHQPVARPALPAHATASSASALEALAALRAQNRELRKQARRQSASVQRRSERVMKVVAKESKRLGDLLMKSIQDD